MGAGKYGRNDHLRPIYKCTDKGSQYRICMVMQETVNSYLVRWKDSDENQVARYSTTFWKRKKTLTLGDKVATVDIRNNYLYKPLFLNHETKVESYASCPKCRSVTLIKDLNSRINHWMYWSCPSCQAKNERENFEILFKYDFESSVEVVIRDESGDIISEIKGTVDSFKLTNDCPSCGAQDNKMDDKINKIIHCKTCGLYYVGELIPEAKNEKGG